MKLTKRKLAIISGISLIIMAIAAGISYGYVHTSLVDKDSISETIKALTNNLTLYRMGLIAWSIVILTDLIVTFSIYYILRPFSRSLSLINAGLRFIYTLFLITAVYQLFKVNHIVSTFTTEEAIVEMTSSNLFDKFDSIWSFGLIIFGLHLLVMGWILFKHKVSHVFISCLLMFAGLSYFIVHSLSYIWVDTLESFLVLPMALGELIFAFWLIIKGGKES